MNKNKLTTSAGYSASNWYRHIPRTKKGKKKGKSNTNPEHPRSGDERYENAIRIFLFDPEKLPRDAVRVLVNKSPLGGALPEGAKEFIHEIRKNKNKRIIRSSITRREATYTQQRERKGLVICHCVSPTSCGAVMQEASRHVVESSFG